MNYDIQCEVSMVLCIDWNHQGIIESVLLLSTISRTLPFRLITIKLNVTCAWSR